MCMFCAAVPMTVALGAAAHAKQQSAKRTESQAMQEISEGETTNPSIPQWVVDLPTPQITLVVIGGLVAGSVVYHSRISPV